jgi:hypothetical protein
VAAQVAQPDVCAIFYGLANMQATWESMPRSLRTALDQMITNLSSYGAVCLACTTYSMGRFGMLWDSLSDQSKASLEFEITNYNLTGQTIANTIYGMGLMQAKWFELSPTIRIALCNHLQRMGTQTDHKPQHVSNILWGLAKMEAHWRELPALELEQALREVAEDCSQQELANAVYGLGLLETKWADLSLHTVQNLANSFSYRAHAMLPQV